MSTPVRLGFISEKQIGIKETESRNMKIRLISYFCLSHKVNIFDKSELEEEQLIRSPSQGTPTLICPIFLVSDLGIVKIMMKMLSLLNSLIFDMFPHKIWGHK